MAKKENKSGQPPAISVADLNEAKLKKLLDQQFDINAPINRAGRTLLIEAEEKGLTDTVRLLLKYKADVNIADKKDKQSALLLACFEGHEDVVKILIDHKADIHHVKKGDKTALMYAAKNGNPAIVRLLIEKGIKLDRVNDEGQNALMYAADSDKKLQAFKAIAEAGADIDLRDGEGKPVIFWSAGLGSVEITRYLLEKGADLSIIDSFGSNVFNYAKKAKRNNNELMELVKGHGVKKLPYCYGFSIEIKCPSCGIPVAVNGPARKVKCPNCQSGVDLKDGFWEDVLGISEDSGKEMVIGSDNTDKQFRKMNPVCPSCKTGIDASLFPVGGEGTIPCRRCKKLIPYFPPPDWLEDIKIRGGLPVQIIGATESGSSASSETAASKQTVAIACISCGAPLRVDAETPRNATCGHCGTLQYLPDPLWLSLHPAKKREWWYIRLS